MTLPSRPYVDVADLRKIQVVTADWIGSAGFRGYLHPGDIALRLFNGMRRYVPREIIRLWENADGDVLGWAFVYPPWQSYDVLLHPSYQGSELDEDMLEWAEGETWRWMQREGRTDEPVRVEVFDDDSVRIALLERRGYQPVPDPLVIAQRSLIEPILDVPLADGFSIRSAYGEQEAGQLIVVQNAAFGAQWTPDEFRRVMQSPWYDAQLHLVVEAPDGRLASFCYLMLDPLNQIGMFEDVGTHPDFRRLGLARTMLLEGMRRMKRDGMKTAFMPYGASNHAAHALYESVGFRIEYNISHYAKSM